MTERERERERKILERFKANNKDVRWHTLVWHNQSPKWIFEDVDGKKASKELLEDFSVFLS